MTKRIGSGQWRDRGRAPVQEPDDAVAFVEAVGFCTWVPFDGVDFPNLAEAMLGGEPGGPVATGERHYDPHYVLNQSWFWKDDLHVARRLFYGKIIHGQPSFIAPDLLPILIAALAGIGREDEREPRYLYAEGRLSREAYALYEYLSEHPGLPTRDLSLGSWLRGRELGAARDRALVELQRRFLVCKTGITGRTRATYSYIWDLTERFWPEACEPAGELEADEAREQVRERLRGLGIVSNPVLERRLFWWR